MNRLLFFLPVIAALTARADEAVNKLVAGHNQALQSASLPIHRKLLAELQKLEAQYTKSGQRVPLEETQAEIVRVKQLIADASQPAGGVAGPQPSQFKLLYSANGMLAFGSWDNGELKPLPRGFAWTNKGQHVALVYNTVLKGAFEAEFTWKGVVHTQSLGEADYAKYVQLYNPVPTSDDKHTLKVKRTAAGAISAELDGKPFTYAATEGARQDMHLRFMFYVAKDASVEFRDVVIKDLSTKKN